MNKILIYDPLDKLSTQQAILIGRTSQEESGIVLPNNSKLRVPRSLRTELDISLNYLCFEIFLFKLKSFSLEISISDETLMKRKLVFSQVKSVQSDILYAKFPLTSFDREKWLKISIDLESLVHKLWNVHFKYIDSVCVYGTCKVSQIHASNEPEGEIVSSDLYSVDSQFKNIPRKALFEMTPKVLKSVQLPKKTHLKLPKPKKNIFSNPSYYDNFLRSLNGPKPLSPPIVKVNNQLQQTDLRNNFYSF